MSARNKCLTGWELIDKYQQPFSREEIESTVPERFRYVASQRPHHPAIVSSDGVITYGRLDEVTDELAAYLWRECGPSLEVISILEARGAPSIVAALAILKAGKIFLALNERHPLQHLRTLLDAAGAQVILTSSAFQPLARTLLSDNDRCLLIDDSRELGLAAPPMTRKPDDTALLLQTSGSISGPKLVMRSHAQFLHTAWSNCSGIYLTPDQRVSVFAFMGYSLGSNSVMETLLNGATIAAFSVEEQSVTEIISSLRTLKVSVLKVPAPLLAQIVSEIDGPQDLPALRLVRCGGQTLHQHVVTAFKQKLGQQCALVNCLGTSETAGMANTPLPDELVILGERIPVGRPVADKEISILDDEGKPVAPGETGEIAVRSRFISQGYWRDPELTRQVFLPDPEGGSKRIYLSGDIGRFRPDGLLEHHGRKANFTKIRGFRVHPAEVEAIISKYEGVQTAVVLAVPDSLGDDHLVAYVSTDDPDKVTASILRRHIQTNLPDFMLPSRFVFLNRFPVLSNGKVDRRTLPFPGAHRPQLDVSYVPPSTEIERELADIWAEVLGLDHVGIHDQFIELGGHSLQAMQIISRVRSNLHVPHSYHALFRAPTVAGMAQVIVNSENAVDIPTQSLKQEITAKSQPELVPNDAADSDQSSSLLPTDPYPLSYPQEQLWFLDQLQNNSHLYNIPNVYRFTGILNIDALRRAFTELIRQHEVLRTTYTNFNGKPMQIVQPNGSFAVPVHDLRHLESKDQQKAWRKMARIEADRHFDLEHDLMIRVNLYRIAENEYLFLLVKHHIIFDAWSTYLMMRELSIVYNGAVEGHLPALPSLPMQYKEFAVWQREQMQTSKMAAQLAYWHRQLSELKPLKLLTDGPFPAVKEGVGRVISFQIDPTVAQGLSALAHREHATPFMVLLAAFYAFLHRYAGQEDIAVGTPVANRQQVDHEKLIGYFVNMLVMRADLSGKPSFRELLLQVRNMVLDALQNQELPYAQLITSLQPERQLGRNPMFQVVFQVLSQKLSFLDLVDIDVKREGLDVGNAPFDLDVSLQTYGAWRGRWKYSLRLFHSETAERMVKHYLKLLASIVADPDQELDRLPLLTTLEEQLLLRDWNNSAVSYPSESSIHSLFEGQAQITPQATAVFFEGQTLTFAELDQRANQLAHHLIQQGVQPGELVGLMIERSLELIVAILAILKSGGAYLPLDSDYPRERINWMLADAACRIVVSKKSLGDKWPGGQLQIITVDDEIESSTISRQNPDCPDQSQEFSSRSVAYVMYTSGSSGRPKGVVVPHRAVVRLVKNASYADLGPEQRFLQLAPVSFDASTLEIWGPLLNGGKLFIYPPGLTSLARLASYLREHQITYLWLTSGLFHQMVEHEIETLSNVPQVQSGGDVVSSKHVRLLLQQEGICSFSNCYGPTENTTFTTSYPVTNLNAVSSRLSIGKPINNSSAYILDSNLKPVPIGVAGELFAGGDGLALGYLNRSQLTQERFIHNPFDPDPDSRLYRTGDLARYLPDGNIEFLGRLDRQIKLRGYRIEPGEIESMMESNETVQQAVVVMHENEAAGKQLIGFVVPQPGLIPKEHELKHFLSQQLPEYMIPLTIKFLRRFPLTANGKVDRHALSILYIAGAQADTVSARPKTAEEEVLIAIWQEVLSISTPDVNANFFDAGGHSLLAIRLFALIEERVGKRLPVSLLFEAPTIALLAAHLSVQENRSPSRTVVPIQTAGSLPPLFCVHGFGGGVLDYADLSRALGSEQPFYGLQAAGLNGNLPPDDSIESMASRYVKAVREVQPAGPYNIGGYCFGGVIAFEMARQLHMLGESTAMVALIEGHAPYRNNVRRTLVNRQRLLTIWRNIPYWAHDYLSLGVTRLRRRARVKLRQQAARLRGRFGHPVDLALEDMVDIELDGVPEHQQQLMLTQLQALTRYSPAPHNGRVILFRARQQTISKAVFGSQDPTKGWSRLALGGVNVHQITGAHRNIHLMPNVVSLATALGECLHESSAGLTNEQ